MSAITFACPECHTILKPIKPIPAGKKVQCPKCSHVFVPPPDESKANAAVQAKPRAAAPAPRRREPEDDAWEVIDDEAPPHRQPPRESVPLAQLDEPLPETEPDHEDHEEPPRRKPPRKPRSFEETDKNRGDELAGEDDDERPRPKKRRKPKTTGVNQLVKIYLILGAFTLLLLAGGGCVAAWLYINRDKNRGTGNEDLLSYAPADSAIIIGIDVGALMMQPWIAEQVEKAFKETNDNTRNFVKEVQKETGLEYKDLFDHTIWAVKQPAAPAREPPGLTLILKSRIAFDQNKIRKCCQSATAQKHKGKTYFQVSEGRFTTLFMPSNWIIVFTNVPEAQVQALIDSNGTQPALPADTLNLARQAAPSHLWGVAPFDRNIRLSIQKQMAQAGPMLPANFGETLSRAKAASLSGTLEGNSVRFQVSLACTDPASAKQAADGLQSMWEKQGKGQVAMMTAVVPKFIGGFIKELTDSLQFSSQGTSAQASAQVNVPTLQALVKEAQNQPAGSFQPVVPGS